MRYNLVASIVIVTLFVLTGCEMLNSDDGNTYNYPCAYKANELAKQSKDISQKMLDMGCNRIISSDALYARCKELEADGKKVIRE